MGLIDSKEEPLDKDGPTTETDDGFADDIQKQGAALGALITAITPSIEFSEDFSGLHYSAEGVLLLQQCYEAFAPPQGVSFPWDSVLIAKNEVPPVLRTLFHDLNLHIPIFAPGFSKRLAAVVSIQIDSITEEESVQFRDFLQLLSMCPWADYLPRGRFELQIHAQELTPRKALEQWVWEEFCTPTMPKLTEVDPENMEDYLKGLFRIVDKDGDGSLNPKEFIDLIELSGFSLTEKEMWKLMKDSDLNGDGVLQYEEFTLAMSNLLRSNARGNPLHGASLDPATMEAYLKQLFAIADQNGDGVLQPRELINLLEMSGLGFSKKKIRQLVMAADSNKDGVIDIEEFSACASQILTPKLDIERCIVILDDMYAWMDLPTPAILKDQEAATSLLQEFCITTLGYPESLKAHNDFVIEPAEFLQLLEEEPWRSSMRDGMLEPLS